MNFNNLEQEFKDKRFNNIYLFWGEEKYKINEYLQKYEKEFINENYKMFNYVVIEGNDIEANIISNCSTLPMMSEHKMVVVKNSKFFQRKVKEETDIKKTEEKDNAKRDELIEFFKNLSKNIHLFFIEESVNKTLTLYKRLNEQRACLVEFKHLSDSELCDWVIKKFKAKSINIKKYEAGYLINFVGNSMQDLTNEIDKLVNYIGYGNDVEVKHIELLCVPTLQAKVFEMLDSISNKNSKKAYELLKDMLILKEPIQKINVLVARQFRIMFLVKVLLEKGVSSSEISNQLKLSPFVVSKTINQVTQYTTINLANAIGDILEIDCKAKTGRVDPILGMETFIGKYSRGVC